MNKEINGDVFIYQDELEAFNETYYKYNRAVYLNIFKMVKDHDAAEDLLQEVFIALWNNRQMVDSTKADRWLFVVSYNKSVNHLKNKIKAAVAHKEQSYIHHQNKDDKSVQEEEYVFDLRLSLLEEAIEHLPKRKKDVLMLYRFEGKSTNEVAGILNISENSVRDYLKQSTRFIKKYIQTRYPELQGSSLFFIMTYFSS